MLLVFLFFAYDSLPPLPDLSTIVFPEPPLWIEPSPSRFMIHGYYGEFDGLVSAIEIQRFFLHGHYQQKSEWDSVTEGMLSVDYSIPLPHFWFKPSFKGWFINRRDDYRLLNPSIRWSSTLPWSMIFAEFDYDAWQINHRNYYEHRASLDIIFDQTQYLPQIEISEIYTDKKIKPDLEIKLHIRNFHVGFGTPLLYGFIGPRLEIQYLDPLVKIETRFRSGTVYQRLSEYFCKELPIRYRIPVPDETLRIGIDAGLSLDLYKYLITLRGTYNRWSARLYPGENLILTTKNDVQDIIVTGVIAMRIDYSLIKAWNFLRINHTWSDTIIPFFPRYDLSDSINLTLGPVEIGSDLHYLSARDGINKSLSPIIIINPNFGIRWKFIKAFISFFNILNTNQEIYDNFYIAPRQYSLGFEIDYRL